MVVVGRTSHALFFDGVTDSVIIPQGSFSSIGNTTLEGVNVPLNILKEGESANKTAIAGKGASDFVIEAWVVPDCGGVIAKRDGQFELRLGTVDTPGPAYFEVYIESLAISKKISLTTAVDATTRWDGITYPQQELDGIHDSYNRYDTTTYGEATNLNFKHRPLYHIVAGLTNTSAFLFVNGVKVASYNVPENNRLKRENGPVYIGGEGGQFRGAIEAIHFSNTFSSSMSNPVMPTLLDSSSALYRFEEPIDVIDKEYTATPPVADATTFTISTTDAQELITRLTGNAYDSSSPITDFRVSPFSMGDYKVIDYYTTPGSPTTFGVTHTPYNLLFNPGAINRNTQKPNLSPPERVRLHSIDGSTGTVTISSIHIDFINGVSGLRGFLHSRTTDVDDYFVVLGADLLIDNGTGKPYQPPHYGSQIFDKTGQMVLDESDNAQHALMYSSRMATTTNEPNNPFAVTWPSTLDTLFQIGHSGRHTYSHIVGHEYMRRYPKPTKLSIDQTTDGSADVINITYDGAHQKIGDSIAMNTLVDIFSANYNATIKEVKNSTTADTSIDNGLPTAKKEMIAITGADFDFRPFVLKGPVPSFDAINDSSRLYHLTPETIDRIAILKVPTLQTAHNLAPFVEIHYNALDLTGDSMNKTTPCLMVQKTVPAGSYDLGAGTRVLDVINADLANALIDTTLYAPGGVIELRSGSTGSNPILQDDHSLLGDNTGGQETDEELDFSSTPKVYTPPNDLTADPATAPFATASSHNNGVHDSVFHKLLTTGYQGKDSVMVEKDVFFSQMAPVETKSGQAEFDIGPTFGATPVHEMFDIIDNHVGGGDTPIIFIQPSDRTRTNQLAQLRNMIEVTPNKMELMFLLSRARLRSIESTEDPKTNSVFVNIVATGIAESVLNNNASIIGSGSPDSHVVKEIEPNSPIVTVTLGGPGQGAINTKPTYDPSPLMRLPGSTRRACAVQGSSVTVYNNTTSTTNILSVQPLNNKSPDMASWGTYCFPKLGRVYLESGASAEYSSKTGAGFFFDNSGNVIAERRFLTADGTAVANFYLWCNDVGLISETSGGTYSTSLHIFNDGDFKDDSMAQDGSTVNDRLFQSMDTVTHDYQLGTQFASTRAMVEIPIFPQQFFDHETDSIFPGPDNSMKIKLDATYTAHSWNPTPVGRRADDIQVADRSATSAFSHNQNNNTHVESARIMRVELVASNYRIYVSQPSLFPPASSEDFRNHKDIQRYRRCFLANGMWGIYNNDPSVDGYINVPQNGVAYNGGFAEGFFEAAKPGTKLNIAQGYKSENLIPIDSDETTPSSDFEGRSPYYYDSANMQTQGGNLDYGMRQYVSAVEFKAGPLANPHSPRTESGRAESTIVSVPFNAVGIYVISLEDASSFPDVPFSRDSSNGVIYEQGDNIFTGEITYADGTTVEVLYYGYVETDISTPNNVYIESDTTLDNTQIIGAKFKLKKAGHVVLGVSSPANSYQNEKKCNTFLPTWGSGERWTFAATAGSGTTTTLEITNFLGTRRMAHANTIGINIRKDDEVYVDDGSHVSNINYLGKVTAITSPMINHGANTIITLAGNNAHGVVIGDHIRIGAATVYQVDDEAILNRTWLYPYATGGLRNGDTVWMNMTINNPHAVEGLFAKSRGVFNEGLVWKGFNGGEGVLTTRPRDSIPLENFLIGNSCLETAKNFAQHINKTIEMNYESMGLLASQAPTVAYIDPYLATDGHARVLMFDVAHDREFIAFHDLHMQVQSSAATPTIGFGRDIANEADTLKLDKFLISVNGGAPYYFTTQIDVTNGFPSENKYVRATQQSKFIESAYAHDIANSTSRDLINFSHAGNSVSTYSLENPLSMGNNAHIMGKAHGHFVHTGLFHEGVANTHTVGDSTLPRVQPAVASIYWSNEIHKLSRKEIVGADPLILALKKHRFDQNPAFYSFRDASTLMDTPDGTRAISAFLSLKGIRNTTLNLSNHEEDRLEHLEHWTKMDFVRRQEIDLGEVGVKEGVTDIEAAAREIVRLVNQGGAKNGRTHARRPSHQYPGESRRLDLTRIGVRRDLADKNKDPTSAHINADFAATGSTYDPAPWWFSDIAFDSHDRGSHMGYVRAHIGRVVEDLDGNEGFSIVIHSTIPGASGRNFAVWLDNSKGQAPYRPQFLIGHGGRFRNFWCQPDETLGENMHPAPLPLNKHGRPFTPVTTLREYIIQEEPDEPFVSNHDIGARRDDTSNPEQRNTSARIGGINSNTVSDESFEAQSPATNLVEGLRAGKNAIGRINFGGLVASGVPGFAPDAGVYGFGRRGNTQFDTKYGQGIVEGNTTPQAIGDYTNHVNNSLINEDSIGDTPIYGFRFSDHRGQGYGVRYIYRTAREAFANENTILPSTFDDEICIFFDDKDVSQGGFTIGSHMLGYGDSAGRLDRSGGLTEAKWRGNRWNGKYAPDAGVDCEVTWDGVNDTLTVVLKAPFNTLNTVLNAHTDILGYLGYPKINGIIHLHDTFTGTNDKGSLGNTFSYESRSINDLSGVHTFYGVRGAGFNSSHYVSVVGVVIDSAMAQPHATNNTMRVLLSSRLNMTTLITDEVLALATTVAINATNPNTENGIPVDCRHLLASDGRTLGEWGVSATAIIVRAHNPQRGAKILSRMFEATIHTDYGIQAAHIEYGEYKTLGKNIHSKWTLGAPHNVHKPIQDYDIDKQRQSDSGYLPKTIIQIRTKGRGYHANTPTPILVDSFNDPVSVKNWQENLKGIQYTSISGDHILPSLNNPIILTSSFDHVSNTFTLDATNKITHVMIPAGQEGSVINTFAKKSSFGEKMRLYYSDGLYAIHYSVQGVNSLTQITYDDDFENNAWAERYDGNDNVDCVLQRFGNREIGGYRSYGSVDSEPIIYFRGARDSNDHSVPLYFGGGFSGVVMDVNDGTQNDYADSYTHPYSNGPTGTAGIQHANEISTSFALMDCNALLAFFPGTAFLNQHRGSIGNPVNNQDSIVTTDLDGGAYLSYITTPPHVTAKYSRGVIQQRPVPLVVRVGHPTARYEDYKSGGDTGTTYIIFGPGQAFPFTETIAPDAETEPHPGFVVTTGNTWSKVPFGENLPNDITNTVGVYGPEIASYQTASQRFQWNTKLNWSPAQGIPNIGDIGGSTLIQRPEHGFHYGEHFLNPFVGRVHAGSLPTYKRAHPLKFNAVSYYGISMSADMTFHMDGGYHPGGSWLDNQMSFNPPHIKSDYRIEKEAWNAVNPTSFRVSGVVANQMILGANAELAVAFEREYIVVDATRCNNGEELAAILGQSMNENPGKGAIKAMGGTHLPSMGNAMRQDRYGWVELQYSAYMVDGIYPTVQVPPPSPINLNSSKSYVEATMAGGSQDLLEQIPASGWIRTPSGGRNPVDATDTPAFAPYHSREVYDNGGTWTVRFWLAPNQISGFPLFEDLQTWDDKCTPPNILTFPLMSPLPTKLFVWSKAGVHRFNNENEVARDHMTQVHFSGIVDAIDRTRPVGAVGWAGERYSYLNSLKVGTEGYGAGLGAWHPKLGFSPYGSSNTCMSAFGHLPNIYPMPHSPEASARVDGQNQTDTTLSNPYTWDITLPSANPWYTSFAFEDAEDSLFTNIPLHMKDITDTTFSLPSSLHHPQGVFSKGFLVISFESELPLIAKYDRDGITGTGDWLAVVSKTRAGVAAATAITFAGTVQWDERIHDAERFIAPANAGPNVEALIASGTTTPTANIPNASFALHAPIVKDEDLYNAEPCFAKTGDLFFDMDESPGSSLLEDASNVERNIIKDFFINSLEGELTARYGQDDYWLGDTNAYKLNQRSPSKNFSVEHTVWKRMDGGNLSLPAVNARGLGSVPFLTRVKSDIAHKTGEMILGNCRFTFETTNSAMFPIIQAQELSHPQIAAQHPDELRNVLTIPNEELQFEEISVEDDTGQIHTIEGGSPFGTIIRTFNQISNRSAEGLAPAEAGSGIAPNLKVQLPDSNSIPGNLIVRSGFDRLQAYQTETLGSGGMLRPDIGTDIEQLFTDEIIGPRLGPSFADHEWEHISQNATGEAFPDMTRKGWDAATGGAPTKSSYELHDRTLFFHITKNGNTHSHKYPTYYTHAQGVMNNELTAVSFTNSILTVNTAIDTNLYPSGFTNGELDGRRFLRLYDPVTDRGGVASFTTIAGSTFTGCVGDADFDTLVKGGITTFKVVPSYYLPAGSTRFYASRRMRDHAEISGNSPDMAHTQYYTNIKPTEGLGYEIYSKPKLTPLALPRMGHHFVTPTMAVLPGHWAHPAYQGLYGLHRSTRSATIKNKEISLMADESLGNVKSDISSSITDQFHGLDPQLVFGSLNATPSGPSDIHGGAFSLMFETKIKYDGYGVLASKGQAGVINAAGGHSIVLEAAATYTLKEHFPDPSEVGAYQIIIQPNLHSSQLIGYHANGAATGDPLVHQLPNGTVNELTSQQVALVVGIREPDAATGALALVLANATMADVRGCEIFVNEVMIDHDPDHGSQFANIPPLMLYNPLGIQSTESPAFTRRSLPYHPGMFANTSPGMTTNIPWWSIVHKIGPDDVSAEGYRHLSHHRLDGYYEFLRASTGSIACQITLAGYPSISPDMYSEILENISLTPVCEVVSVTATTITVDDARGFPKQPYYGNKLEYTDANGVRRTHTYTERSGYDVANMNNPKQFTITALASFTNNLTAGTKLRLTRAYDFRPSGKILSESSTSIITRSLPQTLQGSRDTNSLHMADAFLCLWHPNLGRPHTFYSDSGRTWLNPLLDRAIDEKPLNSMPEHFETIHYHDASYYTSMGPFTLHMKTPTPPERAPGDRIVSNHILNTFTTSAGGALAGGTKIIVDGATYTVSADTGTLITINETPPSTVNYGGYVLIGADGSVSTAVAIEALNGPHIAQGGQWDAADSSTKSMLNHYWPCGSRGGPLTSRLDGYAYVSAAWDYPREYTFDGPVWVDHDDDGSYAVSLGITKSVYDNFTDATCDTTNTDATVTMDSTTKLAVGMGVSGTGIASGATVLSITDASTFELSANATASNSNTTLTFTPVKTRTRPFGYRFSLSQPYNKPQWALYGMRAYREAQITATNISAEYQHGPLVQQESQTWTYAGGKVGISDPTYDSKYVGVMERQTNFSGMLGVDKSEFQVRYSEGMRFTRPFGCPVRTLRNQSSVLRDWWGDGNGKNLTKIDEAVNYYLVDWWGNTRGEDVRRHPVRGFGIRPAWDAGDAYEYDRTKGRTPYRRLYNSGKSFVNLKGIVATGTSDISISPNFTIPRLGGRLNDLNNNDALSLVDVFMPTNSHRVGDMGGGRGIRYPTMFNEDILTALDEPIHTTGVVLSHHTSEPITNDGFIRARNDVLQPNEVPRGMSSRLDIAEDGLLKVGAVASDRVEDFVGDSPHKDAVSRSSPRIGLDTENIEGVDENLVIINTEAHSLHTDRNVGQRVVMQGGMVAGSQTLGDYDLTRLDFSASPSGGAMRLSHTSNFNPLGGTYLAETRNFLSPLSDMGWGGIPSSGMALWLRADSLDLTDASAVATWKDMSGNGHDFTGYGSAQPTYRSSDVDFNNMPVVDCDGNDKMSIPFSALLNTDQITLFTVAAVNSDDGNYHGIVETRSSSPVTRSGFNLYGKMSGSNEWTFWFGSDTGWTQITSTSAIVPTTPAIVTSQISGGDGAGAVANSLIRVNGTQEATNSGAFWKSTADPYQVGNVAAPYYLNGQIAEVIQYNRVLTDAEMLQVEGYLATKYGITGASTWKSSNPYANESFEASLQRTNITDKTMTFMLRPVRLLDKQHAEIFRPNLALDAVSPQFGSNYFSATAGGRYGLYVYETVSGRASSGSYVRVTNPDTNPPYAPAYFMDISANENVPMSQGPKIIGTGTSTFDSSKLENEVTRLLMSENTLQHYRADAVRRHSRTNSDEITKRLDYNVEPRFSQSLHPKGHKGDVTFNTKDHSGDGA